MINKFYPNNIRWQRFEEADRLFFRPLLEEWARRGHYVVPMALSDDNGRNDKKN